MNSVSVTIQNKSSQTIHSLELFQGTNHTKLGRLELDQTVCFNYTCAGESTFRIIAVLQSGDTLLSENYAEGGYQLHLMIEDHVIKSVRTSRYN